MAKLTSNKKKRHRINDDLPFEAIIVIDQNGDNLGMLPIAEALELSRGAGLDLVEVDPSQDSPVARVMDYRQSLFKSQKKQSEARKKQKTSGLKEIKLRPNIDKNDYEVKMRAVEKFFSAGDKVKITLRFRGRELRHRELGIDLITRVRDQFEDSTRIEQEPKFEGRQVSMILAPIPTNQRS